MQPLVLMGVVFVAAVMWVGVIMTMLVGLDRKQRHAKHLVRRTARRTIKQRRTFENGYLVSPEESAPCSRDGSSS